MILSTEMTTVGQGDRIARVGVLVDLHAYIDLGLVVGHVSGGRHEILGHGGSDDVGDDVLVELHARRTEVGGDLSEERKLSQ
jgi:hypothetical protein